MKIAMLTIREKHNFIYFMLFFFFYYFIMSAYFPFFSIWMADVNHLSKTETGMVFSSISFFAIVFQPLFGLISDKLGLRKHLLWSITILLILFAPFFIFVLSPPSHYNATLKQRGSLTIWPHESTMTAWTEKTTPEGRGRPLHYSDMAITTVLMMKCVFNLSLRALQGFVNSIFKLMRLSLYCPDYALVSRRAKTVNMSIKTPTRGEISHLVIDGTGLKVFGEGEWKVRQHGANRRRVWRKLHLAADSATHEIICADVSLSGTTDAQAVPGLINQTHRKIREASADGAYDTHYCHEALLRKKIRPLIPPRSGAQYWPDRYYERNHAVANQHLSGNHDVWKKKVGYHRRSVAETAMFRIKTVLGGHLSLRDYDAQVGEAMAMVKALNRMTLLGMPDSTRIT